MKRLFFALFIPLWLINNGQGNCDFDRGLPQQENNLATHLTNLASLDAELLQRQELLSVTGTFGPFSSEVGNATISLDLMNGRVVAVRFRATGNILGINLSSTREVSLEKLLAGETVDYQVLQNCCEVAKLEVDPHFDPVNGGRIFVKLWHGDGDDGGWKQVVVDIRKIGTRYQTFLVEANREHRRVKAVTLHVGGFSPSGLHVKNYEFE